MRENTLAFDLRSAFAATAAADNVDLGGGGSTGGGFVAADESERWWEEW